MLAKVLTGVVGAVHEHVLWDAGTLFEPWLTLSTCAFVCDYTCQPNVA
jgi:hypothetical protein